MKVSEIKFDGRYRGRSGKTRRAVKIYPENDLIYFSGTVRGRYGHWRQSLKKFAAWAVGIDEL